MTNASDQLELEEHDIDGSTFSFTAPDTDDLEAMEYSLVTIVGDKSYSVEPFYKRMEKAIAAIVQGQASSPRADNLLVRMLAFADRHNEVHGYKPLAKINANDYDGCLKPNGSTALYDACYDAIMAAAQYGKILRADKYSSNAVIFVVTDGEDNSSTQTRASINLAMAAARQQETLESLNVILVGVGNNPNLDSYLKKLQTDCGFQQYVNIGDVNAASIAKLQGFVSASITSTSDALGSGGPSVSLSF